MTTSSPIDPSAPQSPAEEFMYRQALAAVQPELAALSPERLASPNLDVLSAVMIVRGAVPEIMTYRERMVAELPSFDIAKLDKLETYALALGHAHTLQAATSAPTEPVEDMQIELTKLRDIMLSDLQALARRHLIDAERLGEMRGPVGYKNLAFDAMLFSELIRTAWPRIQNKTAITLEEVARAEALSDRLVKTVGVRDQTHAASSPAADVRQRAYTLLSNAYDDVRRAISFLRWKEDDLEDIAPSLFGPRAPRKKAEKPVTPGAPAPQPATPVTAAPGTPVATPTASPSTGLPGDSPFGNG